MDMKRTKASLSFFVFCVLIVASTTDDCYRTTKSQLTGTSGKITYNGTSKNDSCTWILPLGQRDDYVVVLRFTNIGMGYRSGVDYICTGNLYLPGRLVGSVKCNKNFENAPLIYVSSGYKCNTSDILSNFSEHAVVSKWHNRKELMKYIMMDSLDVNHDGYRNSFSLEYYIYYCESLTTSAPVLKSNATTTAGNNSNTHDKRTGCSSNDAGYVAGIVILAFLLLVACVVIFILCREKRAGQEPKREPSLMLNEDTPTRDENPYTYIENPIRSRPGASATTSQQQPSTSRGEELPQVVDNELYRNKV